MQLLKSKWLRFVGLLILGGLIFWGLSLGNTKTPASVALLEPLPQDPQIQVYFNYAQSSRYINPYTQQERLGDNLEQILLNGIASAQSSIDMAVQELRLPAIAHALAEKQAAGVKVRVILENSYSQPWSQLTVNQLNDLDERERRKYAELVAIADTNGDSQISAQEAATSDALVILQNARIPVIDDTADGSKGSGLMHHKFLIIDQTQVITGSANFTTSGIHGDVLREDSLGNVNHLVQIESPAVAALFTQEFNTMWGQVGNHAATSKFGLQKPYRPAQTVRLTPTSTVTVQFSPTSTSQPWEQTGNGLISRALKTAKTSIDLALFVFSDQKLVDTMKPLAQKGVQVRALVDSGFIYRDYSEALDLMGVALPRDSCEYEDGNAPWNPGLETVGVPQLVEGDVLHHKFGVVDQRLVITGSQNWSDAANATNDETVLVIDNPTVAAHFHREFERLYSSATLGVPDWLQDKVNDTTAQCLK